MDFSDRNRMEGGPIGAGPPGGGGPGGIGGPGGGPPGGGVGGPGGGPPGGGFGGDPGSMPPMKILVRWNSALPVRQSSKGPSEGVAECYLIFVSGLPMMGGGRRGSAEPPDPSTAVERLKSATSLQRKGKDPIFPERVEMVHAPAEGILFAFPRTSGVIAPADKEVTFATDMGPVKIKAKFPLKEMVYQGGLEL
jgi:hypothetical protein